MTDADYRRVFVRMRQQGELDFVLDLLRQESHQAEQQLLMKLRTVLVTEPKELAECHAIQGRLSAYAHLLTVFRTLSEPPVERPKDMKRTA